MVQQVNRVPQRPVPQKAVVNDSQDLMRRLEAARATHDELSKESSRIAGELDALKKRCAELEKRCKDEFGCSSAELPGVVKQMREVAEAAVVNAEVGLGMREAEESGEQDAL